MDYEQKYKHALDLAKQVYDATISEQQKENISIIFPELKESEDERIRKWLYSYFRSLFPTWIHRDITCEEIYAWLEKQGQKSAEWHREDEQNLNACLGYIPDEFLRRWLTDIIYAKCDKSAWSEEDESMYVRTLGILGKCYMGKLPTKVEDELKWFKSLKNKL